LVGHVHSVVPTAVADHMLARQIIAWQSWFRRNRPCLLSVHQRTWYTVCICTCDTQLWHFVFVPMLPTGRSRAIKKFSCWSQSKTSWPPMK